VKFIAYEFYGSHDSEAQTVTSQHSIFGCWPQISPQSVMESCKLSVSFCYHYVHMVPTLMGVECIEHGMPAQ